VSSGQYPVRNICLLPHLVSNQFLRIADELWVMSLDGKISSGAPEDLALSGEFQRVFAGDRVQFDAVQGHFSLTEENEGVTLLEQLCLKSRG